MLFKTWEEWETKARKRFIGYKPDPCHLLNQIKISQFTFLQPFIVKFQEYTNKVLTQQTKGSSGIEQKIISDKFHSLVGIPTFENALTPAYAGLICKANPATLEEAYNIVRENYTIYMECELDKDLKATSKWNPFSSSSRKKEPSIAETIEAKFKDTQSQFEAIYLAHERPSCGLRPMQGPYVFTGNCYNCSDQGHKSERCTKPCSICKSTDHTNFGCNQHMHNTTQRYIAVMMADQYYQNKKHTLTILESVFPLNKKNSSDYIIDHSGPVTSPLIKPRHIRSQAPSPDQDYTPLPLKRHEREAKPSPEEQPSKSDTITTPETQTRVEMYGETFEEGTHASPTTPKLPTPPPTVCNSRWNPEHPNLFTALEEQLDFYDPILAKDDPRYNIVTVETASESPAN
ncbi:hypothetical protein DSO57_1011293 [Entomophthora muscae]|uniref:Uncharacterized protein n=1 Tax=Entomophthora muscae TaxID=34485 RepID=A0ACC2TU19_9FUNG|nr:hypothetical protein DSO57_1011293 [Entomophthora muscae]